MKPWQKGYELEYLKELEEKWDRYNEHSLSPFSEMRKDKIASYLEKKTLVVENDYAYVTGVVTTPSRLICSKVLLLGINLKVIGLLIN